MGLDHDHDLDSQTRPSGWVGGTFGQRSYPTMDAMVLHNSSPSLSVVRFIWNQCNVPALGNIDFHYNGALGLRLVLGLSSATVVCGSDESWTC
jgi:hypothetical protein